MDSAKKQHERFLLDQFLELQGISPTCIEELDPPDFLLYFEGHTVGVEVTELFIQSNKSGAHPQSEEETLLQAAESFTNLIVSKAWKLYFDAGNPPVMSTIWFSEPITPDKKKGDQIAELIARQIQRMSLQNSQEVAWRSSEDENEERSLSESVAIIHTCRVRDLHLAQWTVARPGLVANLTPMRLQEAIDKKAKKINGYKKHAEEIWLLIVADRTRPSQKFSVMPDFPLDSISSPFAKTFYYDYVSGEVLSFEAMKLQRGV